MAGEPALVKVQNALVAMMQTLTGINILPDRTVDEPIAENERPAMVPRIVEAAFDLAPGAGEVLNTIAIDIDIYESAITGDTITAALATMKAQFVAALHADRTLGGLMQMVEERSFTASSDSVPDLGCATLTLEAQFITPRGDDITIMGTSGPIP